MISLRPSSLTRVLGLPVRARTDGPDALRHARLRYEGCRTAPICAPSSCSIRSVTFLNHGSFGACPRAVFERYQEWQLELERQPVLFLARRLDEPLADARAALGEYVGADPDDLVFVPNATSACEHRRLAARAAAAGDEVLSTNLEYGALDLHVGARLRRLRRALRPRTPSRSRLAARTSRRDASGPASGRGRACSSSATTRRRRR